jgi:hypothetical protein
MLLDPLAEWSRTTHGGDPDNCTASMRLTKLGADAVSTVVIPLPWERAEGARATSIIPRENL